MVKLELSADTKKVEADLQASKSLYLPAFARIRQELQEHLETADGNLSALEMLEAPCHAIEKAALKAGHSSLISETLMHTY